MKWTTRRILELADGTRSRREIAAEVGLSPRYVGRVMAEHDCPRLPHGAPTGARNGSYRAGRWVDLDGYAHTMTDPGRPYARYLAGKNRPVMSEHRLVMEQQLGRYLEPHEVVDHIDGLTLHNDPSNLRLFASNGEHLAQTARGPRLWSETGRRNIGTRTDRGADFVPHSTYRRRKERGDVRLLQILRAVFALGIDSPFLSGTLHWLERSGIDPHDDRSLARGYQALCERLEADLQ